MEVERKPLWETLPYVEWVKESRSLLPEEQLTMTLYYSGMVHTMNYDELYTYERNYINKMARRAWPSWGDN